MTQHFTQQDIDEFRECFYLYAQKGNLENSAHLRYIMRSLGYSSTVEESKKYFQKKHGKVDFACFLDILYEHSQKQDPCKEVLEAFKAYDTRKRGAIHAKELRSILMGMGEKMSSIEVDRIFREANISNNSMVPYDDFVKVIATPLPDYTV